MKYLFFFILTIICFDSCRNTLSVERYHTIEEAKQHGVFLYEYSLDSSTIYDLIRIRVKSAFLQQAYRYKNYDSDEKVEVGFQWFVCRFEEDDYWPNYGLDSISSDSSDLYVSWRIKGVDYLNRSRWFEQNVSNPDTIILRIIEYTQNRDSASIFRNTVTPYSVVNQTVLDSLVLIKIQPDSAKREKTTKKLIL